MIPKIVHYCWLSNDELPRSFQMHLENWKKILPDYDFVLWNFEKLNGEEYPCMEWTKEAFSAKRYAWASDPIRLYALYKYGGVYMDLDVELRKTFNPLLDNAYMLGREYSGYIEAGIMGAEPGSKWVKCCMDSYVGKHYIINGNHDDKPLPMKMTESLLRNGYNIIDREDDKEQVTDCASEIKLLPMVYLSAKKNFEVVATDLTYSVHHFAASSSNKSWKARRFLMKHMPWVLKYGSIVKSLFFKIGK